MSQITENKPMDENSIAPAFKLNDLDGETVDLVNYKGRVVLLDLWATWCAPCRQFMPKTQKLHEKYYPAGLVTLAINIEGNIESVQGFINKNKYTFPVLLDKGDLEAHIVHLYKVQSIPTVILIDKNGIIRFKGHPENLDEILIEKLIGL